MRREVVGTEVDSEFSGKVGLDSASSKIDGFLPCLGIICVPKTVDVDFCVRLFGAGDDWDL